MCVYSVHAHAHAHTWQTATYEELKKCQNEWNKFEWVTKGDKNTHAMPMGRCNNDPKGIEKLSQALQGAHCTYTRTRTRALAHPRPLAHAYLSMSICTCVAAVQRWRGDRPGGIRFFNKKESLPSFVQEEGQEEGAASIKGSIKGLNTEMLPSGSDIRLLMQDMQGPRQLSKWKRIKFGGQYEVKPAGAPDDAGMWKVRACTCIRVAPRA